MIISSQMFPLELELHLFDHYTIIITRSTILGTSCAYNLILLFCMKSDDIRYELVYKFLVWNVVHRIDYIQNEKIGKKRGTLAVIFSLADAAETHPLKAR